MDGTVTPDDPARCERAGLLLSLAADAAATPAQAAELADHLGVCGRCRADARVDAAVRARLAARGTETVAPGFAARVAAALPSVRSAAQRAAQDRFLRFAAAAALVVAVVSGTTVAARRSGAPSGPGAAADPRDLTHWALVRPEAKE